MKKHLAFLASCILLFFSCGNKNNKQQDLVKDTTVTDHTIVADSLPSLGYFKLDGDSLVIPSFEIEISLSPKARDRMVSKNETIIVNATFTGEPKDRAGVEQSEDGQFYLGSVDKEIHYGEPVKFENIKFARKRYELLANKDIDMLINVYTGRHSSEDNLIDCEILSEKMSKVMGRKFMLKGKLIYGDE
jgi:hypothetical protein